MKLFFTLFGSMLALAVAAFCVFGFLATFEPSDNVRMSMASRVGYAVIGVACLSFVLLMAARGLRGRSERSDDTR